MDRVKFLINYMKVIKKKKKKKGFELVTGTWIELSRVKLQYMYKGNPGEIDFDSS